MEYNTTKNLERKISRSKSEIEILKIENLDNPNLIHAYQTGWSLGYWEGKLSVLEEVLEEIAEIDISTSQM